MHEYVSYIFHLVRQDGALAIAVVFLVLTAAAVVYAVLRRQGRVFPWKRAAVLALLAGYLAALCSMTLTGRESLDAVTFASLQPLEATVTACTITYQSDTKGFYQPVYRFTVMQGEAPFAEVRIPALQ